MFRRASRLLAILLAGLALIASGACSHSSSHTENSQPAPRDANVLLVTLDTTRADHLSCYAPGHAKTPNIDALAARGVRFAHDTSDVPLTLPSHACIMTGSYPEVNGMRDMGGFILAKSHPTIASIAEAAGYSTAAVVGSSVLNRTFGISNGFASYDDNMGSGPTDQDQSSIPGVFPERRASVVTDHAIDWLKTNGDHRFFLWVHYYDAHAPYEPPEPYHHRYAHDLYSGEIAYVDHELGRLFDYLKQQGLDGRTLIVVTGDHGESLGQHGELTHGVFLYDATLHVPLIVAGPGVPSGKVFDEQVRSIDIEPTITSFLNLSPGSESEGVSLWPLIKKGQQVRSDYAYLETLYPRTYMGWSELRGIRTGKWKFILAPHPELYNLERDPHETHNVIATEPLIADHLEKQIWQVIGSKAQHEKVVSTPVSAQTREELASLGYVSAGTPRVIQLGTKAPDPKDETGVLKFLNQAEDLLNRKEFAKSARLMQEGLKEDPTNPLAMIYLATSYEGMGALPKAIAVYEKAISMHLRTDQIYSRLGRDYLRTGQLEKATAAMLEANKMNPTDLDNLRNIGTAELQLGHIDQAQKAFEAITVQNDHYAAAYNGLGLVAIARGDGNTALREFQKAIEVDPAQVEPLLNLGLLFQKTGHKQQALHYFQLFLQKAPRTKYSNLIPKVRQAVQELQAGS